MARSVRLNAPGRAWALLCALLAAGTVLGLWLPPAALDWQAQQAAAQPWRWWTAAFVHWSRWHAIANLAGLALVAALGARAGLPARAATAWTLAWPLTHLGLWLRPDLAVYGGLSGVLHAGVAVAAWTLWQQPRPHERRDRLIGAALLAGLGAKVLLEAPWGPALRHPADWDIAIAPWAHASGVCCGLLSALALVRRHQPPG